MKHFLVAFLLVFSTVNACAWLPVFVGHRGCANGVENTEEAYRYAVSHYGYAGLECDVRVSSDGEYIISHDEKTTRVGGNLEVSQSTLEELTAEQYLQKRRGLTYAGKICTLEEFLQICVENNVFPIIELKWANGINNKDMSRFDGVYRLMEKYGLTEKAIILTSMRASLEYILQHYPALHCQFLMMEMTDEKIDWCIANRVEPSVAHTGIYPCQVKRCHDAGLPVAGWTVDNQADYDRIVAMGVEYITTNSLTKNQPDQPCIDWNNLCK